MNYDAEEIEFEGDAYEHGGKTLKSVNRTNTAREVIINPKQQIIKETIVLFKQKKKFSYIYVFSSVSNT